MRDEQYQTFFHSVNNLLKKGYKVEFYELFISISCLDDDSRRDYSFNMDSKSFGNDFYEIATTVINRRG